MNLTYVKLLLAR